MRGLKAKRVLISGGSRGIGKATARRFLEEGAIVFFCGHDAGDVERTIREFKLLGKIDGMTCDVSQEDDVNRLIEAAEAFMGGFDVLVNNAGIAWQEDFLAITAENWDRIMAVNLCGQFLVAQAVARKMVAAENGGAIINMSSTNGLVGEEQYAHYNASKGGIMQLTKTMALELGKFGIRVNALCPGYILTPLNREIYPAQVVEAYIDQKIPLKKAGQPEDIAAAYAFLASDDAVFIHGTGLVIDGGQIAL